MKSNISVIDMNICVVAYKFGREHEIGEHLGTYHYFIEKMRQVVANGHSVYIACPWLKLTKRGSREIDGIKIMRYWPPLIYKIWAWPFNKLFRWFYIYKTKQTVLSIIKKQSIDAVYVWQARETGFAISQIKKSLDIPFIFRQITAWKWHFERPASEIFGKKSWYKILSKFRLKKISDSILEFLRDKKGHVKYAKEIYDKADKVVLLSKAAVREAVEFGLDPKKAEIIGVAIETDIFSPLNKKQALRKELGIKGEKVILFIGRINFAEKGIGTLLEAIPQVSHSINNINLVVIGGGGESDRMNKLLTELHIVQSVQVLGKKPFNDLVKFINASDVFVVPSIWMEAFGQVTIEAMSCGVPVITSDAGASPEINTNSETGYVVPANNPEKLAESIIKIFKDPNLQVQLGKNARKRVLENYSYDVMVNKFLDLISNVKSQNKNHNPKSRNFYL